jgi:hypothetical protein
VYYIIRGRDASIAGSKYKEGIKKGHWKDAAFWPVKESLKKIG